MCKGILCFRDLCSQSLSDVCVSVTFRNSYEDDDDEDFDDSRDYMNMEPLDTKRKQRKEVGGLEEEDSDDRIIRKRRLKTIL